MTPFFYILLGAFGFVLLVLLYLGKTSEYMTRARFGQFLFGIIALFSLLAAAGYWFNRPARPRIRVAVLPVQEELFTVDRSWLTWHIAEQAGDCLRRGLDKEFLVYPASWLWMSVETDSLNEIAYLQRYAERIGLDWAVLPALSDDGRSVTLDYIFVRVQSPNLIRKSQITVSQERAFDLGRLLAIEAARCLNQTLDPPAVTPVDPQVVILSSRASAYLAQSGFDEAVRAAESAFEKDSLCVPVRNLYAAALLKQSIRREKEGLRDTVGRLRALRVCENTIRHHQANAATYRWLGAYYLAEKQWAQAGRHLRKAVTLDPDDAEAFSLYAYLNASRFKEIGLQDDEEMLRHVLHLNPCDESARLRLAEWYFSRNDQKAAEREARALLSIHPRSIDGLMFLGKLAATDRNFAKLAEIYDNIFSIDPHNADAYYNLGIYYYQSEDLDNAEKLFNRAVRLSNHTDSHLYLGQIYERRGEIEKAIEEYRLRIRYKKGLEDRFADVARARLFELTRPDSTMLMPYVR
ncbi:tetratricopeptide repeat protein [bacterium]|nr:tetratricopeptide repeat protein [bacterium]